MSTRAARRSVARQIVKLAPESERDALVVALERVEKLTDWLRSYKIREERLAMALQFISNRIIAGEFPAAQVAMRATMANDLAEARETVGNRAMALDVAISALKGEGDCEKALAQIERLAPEAFGGEVEMTQTKAGRA